MLKQFTKEIKEKEKDADKEGFSRYFNHEPSTIVSKLLSQNIQDLKKRLNKIREQKIELNADETNNTNNKDGIDRLNIILRVFDRCYYFFEYKFLPDKQSNRKQQLDQTAIPKLVKK